MSDTLKRSSHDEIAAAASDGSIVDAIFDIEDGKPAPKAKAHPVEAMLARRLRMMLRDRRLMKDAA
jgi:hypothetical protein